MSSTKGWCITSGWMRLQRLLSSCQTPNSPWWQPCCVYTLAFANFWLKATFTFLANHTALGKKNSQINNSTSHPPLSSYLTSTHHLCACWQEESEWNENETMEPWVGFRGLVTVQAPQSSGSGFQHGFNMGWVGLGRVLFFRPVENIE